MAEAEPIPVAENPPLDHEGGFDRRSRIVAIVVVVIIALSLLQTVYHFSLPTDGWEVDTREVEGQENDQIVFTFNQLGNATPIRAGDVLLSIEGQKIDDIIDRAD